VLETGLAADPVVHRQATLAGVAARVAQLGVIVHALFLPISLAPVQLGILAALAGVAVAAYAARGGAGGVWVRSPLDLAAALIAAAQLLAIAVGWTTGWAPRELETITRWKPVLAPVVLLAALSLPWPGDDEGAPRRRAVRALLAWCAGAAVASVVGIVQATASVDLVHVIGRRPEPLLADVPYWPGRHAAVGFYPWYPQFAHNLVPPLSLAGALALAAPLPRRVRLALGAGAALAFAAVVATVSRGAWASLVVVVGVVLLLLGGRLARLGLPLAAAALVLVSFSHGGLRARLSNAFDEGVNADREIMRAACLDIVREHPLGVGPGNFRRVADPHFDLVRKDYPLRTGCHLMPLTQVIEGGPLLPLAWLAGAAIFAGAFLRWRRGGDALARAASVGALAALASFAVNGLFHDVHRESHATWALGLALGLAAVLARPAGGALTAPARPAGTPPARSP
jgi:hypothetical protein